MKSSTKTRAKLIRPIVPVKEWINDPYFVGPDVENLYPYWKNVIIDIFSRKPEERINQVIFTGGIGIGKSTAAVLIILRVIYELSCYENISSLFSLFGVSRIAFAYLSVTREQAQNTGFSLLVEWIDSIPYFREKFKRKDRLDSIIIWPQERLIITYGSVANHFIGMNLIGSILDEANFFSGRSREEADYRMNTKVSELYTQIITRSESRFIVNGINHSMSILVSSSTVASSFTEERIMKAKDDIHTYVVAPPIWEVKPWNYKGKKFPVYVGGDGIDPFVVEDLDGINMLLESKHLEPIYGLKFEEAIKLLPPNIQSQILMVPVEHKQAFQGDILISLQDLAGYSISAANRLFSSNTAYNRCIKDNISHPFSRQKIILSTTSNSTQDGFLPIKAYLLNGIKFNHPGMKRFMHLDLALSGDSVGISMCHIAGWKSIYKQKSNFEDLSKKTSGLLDGIYQQKEIDHGLVEDEIRIPIIEYDFMLKIEPPKKPNKIALSKIRDFIVYLRNEHKIQFGKITADQFQSAQLLQELDELGFPTGYLSVDRTADAYLSFTNLVYEERIHMYEYKPFKDELFSVIYYPAKKKVDHPAKGSKDIADSVVGSAWNAIKAEDKSDVNDNSLVNIFVKSNVSSDDQLKDAVKNTLNNLMDMLKNS